MVKFLKMLGFGVLYTLLSPFILAFFALYAVYCLAIFIYMLIRNLVIFFAGGNPMGDLPEDVKAKKIAQQEQLAQAQALANASQQPQPQTINNVTQNIYQQPTPNMYQAQAQNFNQNEPVSLPDSVNASPVEEQNPDLIEYNDSSDNKEEDDHFFDDFGGEN